MVWPAPIRRMTGGTRCRRVFLEFTKKVFPDMGIVIEGYPCTPLVGIVRKRRVPIGQTRECQRMAGLALLLVHSGQIEMFASMFLVATLRKPIALLPVAPGPAPRMKRPGETACQWTEASGSGVP